MQDAPTNKETTDPRLVEVVAASLCWAEFTHNGHVRRTDDPMSYWGDVGEHAKAGYRKSAGPLAAFMCGDMKLAIVPNEMTPEMLNAARNCMRVSEANIRQAWSCILMEAWLQLGKIVRGSHG